jgi:leader peptidase (prepilin peptidase)/N-methyltransferase
MPETLDSVPFWLIKATVLALGATFGSFGNVLIHRIPLGRSIVRPGSRCPGCGQAIRWFDNVPILSWVLLRGRCRRCGEPISLRYPLVELCVAVLSLACLYLGVARLPPGAGLAGLAALWAFPFAFAFLLVVVTFIDLEHWTIPPSLALVAAGLGMAQALLQGDLTGVRWTDALIGMAVGAGGLALVAEGWFLLTKREGLGYGDVFLLGAIGAFLGWQSLALVLLAASVQGILVALPVLAFGGKPVPPWEKEGQGQGQDFAAETAETAEKIQVQEQVQVQVPGPSDVRRPTPDLAAPPRRVLQAAVPFGPFLALGAMEWLFFGPAIWHWILP